MTFPSLTDLNAIADGESEDFNPKLRVALSRVAMDVNARLQEGSGSSVEFMTSVIATLKRVKGTSNAEIRTNCLMDVAHYFYVIGQSFSAIEPGCDAVALASSVGHKPLWRKSLTFLGIVYSDTGNISRSVECLEQALDIAHDLQDLDAESVVSVNLGVALLYAAQYQDAISCFDHAIHVVEGRPPAPQVRANAYSNIALCCLHLEDFSRGLKAAESAIRESGEPHSAAEFVARVLRENYYTRLLLEVNSVERAGERCEFSRLFAARSNSARAVI